MNDLRFNVGPLDEVAGWERADRAARREPPPPPHAPPAEVARALDGVEPTPSCATHLVRLYGKLREQLSDCSPAVCERRL